MFSSKVTVIMTTYNSEKYLSRAINSILNQTFSDFELLIVDDDSADQTGEIIASFVDPRIRLIINRERRGVAYAREIALEQSQGEYIAILDSDDIALSDRLQVQTDYLNYHYDVNLVGSAFEIIDENDVLLSTYIPATSPLAIKWELLFKDVIGHSTVMFRRAVALKLGGYDPHFLVAEDFDLWVRFAAYGKIAQLGQPLVQWRFTAQSMQNRDQASLEKFSIEVVMKSIRLQTDEEISSDAARYLASTLEMDFKDETILDAFKTVLNCYKYFNNILDSNEERECLDSLAAEKLLMMVRKKPKSKYAHKILITIAGIRSSFVFSKSFVIAVTAVIIPSGVIRAMKKIAFLRNISTFVTKVM
jgi:hypothetical protein